MKRGLLIVIALLNLVPGISGAQPLVDGIYTGWKKMEGYGEKSEAWFHIHRLTLIGNKVQIESSPRVIKKNELFYSASDGGFFTYKGEVYLKDEKPRIKLRVVDSDYVRPPKDGWPEKDFPIIIRDRVIFDIDDVTYTLQERETEKKPATK